MEKKSKLILYMTYLLDGHEKAGITRGDIAACGGYDRLRARLHDDAAFEVMSQLGLTTHEAARDWVTKYLEECYICRDYKNNYE